MNNSSKSFGKFLNLWSGELLSAIGSGLTFIMDLKDGWKAISERRGVLILVMLTSLITFFIGFLQTLFTPMILAFADSTTLGTCETVVALGILVSSVVIGFLPISGGYIKMLTTALFCSGLFMSAVGLRENIAMICVSGFLFFASLPFANTSIDFLIRTSIENSVQGTLKLFKSLKILGNITKRFILYIQGGLIINGLYNS